MRKGSVQGLWVRRGSVQGVWSHCDGMCPCIVTKPSGDPYSVVLPQH